MPAAENGSLHGEKDNTDRAPIINGMETLPKTKQVTLLLFTRTFGLLTKPRATLGEFFVVIKNIDRFRFVYYVAGNYEN